MRWLFFPKKSFGIFFLILSILVEATVSPLFAIPSLFEDENPVQGRPRLGELEPLDPWGIPTQLPRQETISTQRPTCGPGMRAMMHSVHEYVFNDPDLPLSHKLLAGGYMVCLFIVIFAMWSS